MTTVHYQFTLLSLSGLLQSHGSAAFLNHLPRDLKFLELLLAGQVEHQVKHQLFQNHAQAAGAHFARHSLPGNGSQSFVSELEAHILELEQPLVLLDDGILGAGEDFDQGKFVQIFQHANDGQPSDEFRNQSELDQVLRLNLAEQFEVALARDRNVFLFGFFASAETKRLLTNASADNLLETHERPAADEEDIRCVDGSEFLVRMLASALRRNVGDGSFQNLQQGLLHAFAGDIARNRGIFVLAPDLVDLVNVDDAGLGAAHIALRRLKQFQDDVLDILTHIARFGQRGGIDNGKRHVEHARQSLRQQRLPGARRTDEHDVRLAQLNAIVGLLPVHEDALVVVVNRNRQLLLGLLLPDDVFIEEGLDLLRLGQLIGRGGLGSRRAVVFQDRVAYSHALIANISARIIAGRRDQFGYRILRLVAERTAQNLVGARLGFHSALLLYLTRITAHLQARRQIIPLFRSYR